MQVSASATLDHSLIANLCQPSTLIPRHRRVYRSPYNSIGFARTSQSFPRLSDRNFRTHRKMTPTLRMSGPVSPKASIRPIDVSAYQWYPCRHPALESGNATRWTPPALVCISYSISCNTFGQVSHQASRISNSQTMRE